MALCKGVAAQSSQNLKRRLRLSVFERQLVVVGDDDQRMNLFEEEEEDQLCRHRCCY